MSKFSIPSQALPQNQLENSPPVPAPVKKIFTLELAKWAAKYPHDSDMKIADQRLGYCWMMNAAELDLSGLKLREPPLDLSAMTALTKLTIDSHQQEKWGAQLIVPTTCNINLANNGADRLTSTERSAVEQIGTPESHPEHGVTAILERSSQNANTAKRQRRALLANIARGATRAVAIGCDAAGSTLSCSVVALDNASLHGRAIASPILWSAAGLISIVYHAAFDQNQSRAATVMNLLSDAGTFGAGLAGGSAANLSYGSGQPDQSAINYANNASNISWMVSGTLLVGSAVLSGYEWSKKYDKSLAYTATGCRIASGLANAIAGSLGAINYITSNGNSSILGSSSPGLWTAGSVLDGVSAVLHAVAEKRPQETEDIPENTGNSAV